MLKFVGKPGWWLIMMIRLHNLILNKGGNRLKVVS
jgi:hypothetical protein